jgi:RNA polymerase sigma-70 factor (ECF subfamily)
MTDENAADLLARLEHGDPQAASELFHRYTERLIALAQSRMSAQLAQRIDPEDVVQSAYRSFFAAARAGRFDLQHGGDLWQLLVVITLHKLRRQVRRNSAGKRSVEREVSFEAGRLHSEVAHAALASEPSPIEAVALTEELERLMRDLGPVHRRMLELRLQGYHLDEIAAETQSSERTVRRTLDKIKQQLEDLPLEGDAS